MAKRCFSVILVVSAALFLAHPPSARAEHLTFITVGDWGGVGLGGLPAENALATAKGMGDIAGQNNVSFVINVGDNFYDFGVASGADPLWQSDWKNIFLTTPALRVPWYSVLGNHDYAGNPDAQVNYPDEYWVMPARSYVRRIWNPSASENVTFIFWDSNPCVSDWRGSDPTLWKPDSATFHANIIAQDCDANIAWLTLALEAATDRWVIVVTHVATFEIDMVDVAALLDKYGVSVCFVGHKHRLEYYTVKHTDVDFILSGAASMVKNDDAAEEDEAHQARRDQENENDKTNNFNGSKQHTVPFNNANNNDKLKALKSSEENVKWSQKVTGFSLHRFTHPGNHLETTFYDARTLEVQKIVSSTPQRDTVTKKKKINLNKNEKKW